MKSRRKLNYYLFSGVGSEHAFLYTQREKLYAFGRNNDGELGIGTFVKGYDIDLEACKLQEVKFFSETHRIKWVITGQHHSIFWTRKGRFFSAGKNARGALAIGRFSKIEATPVEITYLKEKRITITKISCGFEMTYFLTKIGTAYSCGNNGMGQLGSVKKIPHIYEIAVGHTDNMHTPTLIESLKTERIEKIEAGFEFVIFMTTKRKIYTCGTNINGQLCKIIPDNITHKEGKFIKHPNSNVPVEVDYFPKNGIKIEKIRAASYSAYFITKDRRLYSGGRNYNGELGIEGNKNQNEPILVDLKNIVDVQGGGEFCVIQTTTGFYGCGWNEGGEYGVGHYTNKDLPTKIDQFTSTNVNCFKVGYAHTFFVDSSGCLWCCGNNGYGIMVNFTGEKTCDYLEVDIGERKIMKRRGVFNKDDEKVERLLFLVKKGVEGCVFLFSF